MIARKLGMIAACLVLAAPTAGCGGGGTTSTTPQNIRTTTTGQELSDLKKAYDSGALTQEEYARERKKILDRAE